MGVLLLRIIISYLHSGESTGVCLRACRVDCDQAVDTTWVVDRKPDHFDHDHDHHDHRHHDGDDHYHDGEDGDDDHDAAADDNGQFVSTIGKSSTLSECWLQRRLQDQPPWKYTMTSRSSAGWNISKMYILTKSCEKELRR